jgi:hypothetical protein
MHRFIARCRDADWFHRRAAADIAHRDIAAIALKCRRGVLPNQIGCGIDKLNA